MLAVAASTPAGSWDELGIGVPADIKFVFGIGLFGRPDWLVVVVEEEMSMGPEGEAACWEPAGWYCFITMNIMFCCWMIICWFWSKRVFIIFSYEPPRLRLLGPPTCRSLFLLPIFLNFAFDLTILDLRKEFELIIVAVGIVFGLFGEFNGDGSGEEFYGGNVAR